LDSLQLHGEGGMPRWQVSRTLIRVTARGRGHTWIYQFPPTHWQAAVKKIMADLRAGSLPDDAAGGLLELIAEGVDDN
jgi:hypothetical protein